MTTLNELEMKTLDGVIIEILLLSSFDEIFLTDAEINVLKKIRSGRFCDANHSKG